MPCPRRSTVVLCVLAGLAAACDDAARGGGDLGVPDSSVGPDLKAAGPATSCAPSTTARLMSNLPGSHRLPRLGFTGTTFLVAWNTEVVSAGQRLHRIDAALADRDGNKLGPNLPMSQDPIADSWAPSVTPLANGTVVAWTRRAPPAPGACRATTDIVVNTLDPSGQRLDENGKPCDPATVGCGQFQVTSSGTAAYPYLERPTVDQHSARPTESQVGLTFVDARNHPLAPPCTAAELNDVYWKKIQANGNTLVSDKAITAAGSQVKNGFPRLAFDGAHEGLVWREETGSNSASLLFATLDAQGAVLSQPKKIGVTTGSYVSAGAPDLLWNGIDYALAATVGSDQQASVVFQRFLSNGQPSLTPIGVTVGGVSCTPAIAWDGEHYAVVWQTQCGQPGSDLAFELIDPQGLRVRADGSSCGDSLDPSCGVTLLTQHESAVAAFPEIAWAGGHSFGITWMSTDGDSDAGTQRSDIYFTRVDCSSR